MGLGRIVKVLTVAVAIILCVSAGVWLSGLSAGKEVVIEDTTVARDTLSKPVADSIWLLQNANTLDSKKRMEYYKARRIMYLDPPIVARQLRESGPYAQVRVMSGWGTGKTVWVEKKYVHPSPRG
jgi:hypothetical protein